MRLVHIVLLLCVFGSRSLDVSLAQKRTKRNLLQLQKLLQCTTGRSFDYLGYGCFCGEGNHGGDTPIDALDACCKKHDNCYEDARRNTHCGDSLASVIKSPFLNSYNYVGDCSVGDITCIDKAQTCKRMACECDKHFVLCASTAPFLKQFSRYYMDYSKCV